MLSPATLRAFRAQHKRMSPLDQLAEREAMEARRKRSVGQPFGRTFVAILYRAPDLKHLLSSSVLARQAVVAPLQAVPVPQQMEFAL